MIVTQVEFVRVERPKGSTLDEDLLKVLSSNTRLEILKHLSQSQMTLTDLARVLDFCKSTVFEHLRKLYDAGLVCRITGRKWIYYRLSRQGQRVLHMMAS
jgi:DNA-binding transcriptional ArsR family regulator